MRIISLSFGFLILLVGVANLAYAEDSFLVIYVSDTRGEPIPSVRLKVAGDGSTSNPTNVSGRTLIRLTPYTRPGDTVKLEIIPAGDQDWVLVSPWDGRIIVPPLDNKPASAL